MVKYNEIGVVYNSPPFPPKGIKMDRVYALIKKDEVLFITDGIEEIEVDEFVLKMLFVPSDESIHWEDVDFSDSADTKK